MMQSSRRSHPFISVIIDLQPLYDARTASLELARLTGAVVVMGSATPDVETYYQARTGQTSTGETSTGETSTGRTSRSRTGLIRRF